MSETKIPPLLHSAMTSRRCYFFVGAGISANAPSYLPTANEIRFSVADWLFEGSDEIRNAWANDLEDFRHWCLTVPLEAFLTVLTSTADESFYEFFQSVNPNNYHKFLGLCISNLIPVVTTNFDTLIEQCCESWLSVSYTEDHFKQIYNTISGSGVHNLRSLFKIHGSIDDRESIIASFEDLSSRGFQLTLTKSALLEHLSRDRVMIILGYSFSDTWDIVPSLLEIRSTQPVVYFSYDLNLKGEVQIAEISDDTNWQKLLPENKYLFKFLKKHGGLVIAFFDFTEIISALIALLQSDAQYPCYEIDTTSVVSKPNWPDRIQSWMTTWCTPRGFSEVYLGRVARLNNDPKSPRLLEAGVNHLFETIEHHSSPPEKWLRRLIQSEISLSVHLYQSGRFGDAKKWLDRALIPTKQYSTLFAKVHASLGDLNRHQSNFEIAEQHYLHALSIFEATGSSKDAINTLSDLAATKFYLGKKSEAIETMKKVIEYDALNPRITGVISVIDYAMMLDDRAEVDDKERALKIILSARDRVRRLPFAAYLVKRIDEWLKYRGYPLPPPSPDDFH